MRDQYQLDVQRFGFKKSERLLKSEEFLQVRRKGKRYSTKSFIIHIIPSGIEVSRLGLSVGAVVGNAVKRNRFKRLLREFFRTHKHLFARPLDIVMSVKKGADIRAYKDVEAELAPLWLRAGKGR
ncbi:MAG: ribonuclease P protein component [Deltaproteobacteria bacterium]|nr:ribonuclease P protein component [Deltaproteobacteria bacterium]